MGRVISLVPHPGDRLSEGFSQNTQPTVVPKTEEDELSNASGRRKRKSTKSKSGSTTSEHTYATAAYKNGHLVMKTVHMQVEEKVVHEVDEFDYGVIGLSSDTKQLFKKLFGDDRGGRLKLEIPKFRPYSLAFYEQEHEIKFLQGTYESMRRRIQVSLSVMIIGVVTSAVLLLEIGIYTFIAIPGISIYTAFLIITMLSKSPRKSKFILSCMYISFIMTVNTLQWSIHLLSITTLHIFVLNLFSSILWIQFAYMATATLFFFVSFMGIAVYFEPNIFCLRYISPFIILVLNGCLISYYMERSERRKYASEFIIKAYQDRLACEKEKNQRILRDLYPSYIANLLVKKDAQDIRNIVSKEALIIHITFYPEEIKGATFTHEYVKQMHRIIDGILSSYSVEKIKSCGNQITAAKNLFETSDDNANTFLELASSIQKYLSVAGTRTVIAMEKGITYGCIIQGERSSFDLFGECVEKSKQLTTCYRGNTNKIYVGDEFRNHINKNVAMKRIPGSVYGWEVFMNMFEQMENEDIPETKLDTDIDHFISWEQFADVKKDLSRAEIVDTKSVVVSEEHMLDEYVQIGAVQKRNAEEMKTRVDYSILRVFNQRDDIHTISLLQVGLSVLSFLTYGVIDIATLSWCNLISWEDGGHLVFMRMCIFLPISVIVVLWQFHRLSGYEKKHIFEIQRKIPIMLGYFLLLYTTFKRLTMFQNLDYGKQGHDFYRDNWNEMYLSVAYAVSNPLVEMRDSLKLTLLNSALIFVAVLYDPYFTSKSVFTRTAIFILYELCPAITSIFGSYLMIQSNKKEVEMRLNKNDQMALLQREIEQTKQSLLSVMPVEVYESIKNNQYGSDRTYLNTVVLNIRIASLDIFLMGLTISQRKKHIEEIADKICELCHLHEMELVKSYGSSFVVCVFVLILIITHQFMSFVDNHGPNQITSGFSDTQKEAASIYLSQTMLRSFEFATKVQERFGSMASASNGRRMELHIGMSIGDCIGGIASSVRFSYDIWGEAVLEAEHLSQVCKAHMILASHRLFGYKDIIKGFRFTRDTVPHRDEHNSTGYFYIDKEEDVVGRFMEAIEWDTDHFLQTNPIK